MKATMVKASALSAGLDARMHLTAKELGLDVTKLSTEQLVRLRELASLQESVAYDRKLSECLADKVHNNEDRIESLRRQIMGDASIQAS